MMIRKILLIAFLLGYQFLGAQSKFEIVKVTGRVYAAIPVKTERVSTTSTIILGDSYITVVEGQSDEGMAAALVNQIRKQISALPIKFLILTHHHLDHVLGAGAFVKAFPDITVISHPYSRNKIINSLEGDKDGFMKWIESRKKDAEEEFKKTKEEKTAEAIKDLQSYLDDLSTSKGTVPNLTVDDSISLFDGALEIRILFKGAGHTPGDLIVYLPSEKLIVTGDLIHDFEPLFWDANPELWVKTLKTLPSVDFIHLIGGHGWPQEGKQVLLSWTAYIEELIEKVKQAMAKKQSLEDLKKNLDISSFTSLSKYNYGQRIQAARQKAMTPTFIGTLENAVISNLESVWGFYNK